MKESKDDTNDVEDQWHILFENADEQITNYVSRRSVLRTGAVASGVVLGGGALTGHVGANSSNDYGQRNGIGSFLNEKAEAKDMPIWDSGIANRTGESGPVEVEVGTYTDIDIEGRMAESFEDEFGEEPPERGPFGFTPRVVKISPGTTVKWVWTENPFLSGTDEAWPHDVHSLDQTFHSKHKGTGAFKVDFDEIGNYLYYCSPHGNPEFNLFGMRGAILVGGD